MLEPPIQIIDVGARGGIHERWTRFGRWVDGVGFEPEPSECARLNEAAASTNLRSLRFLPHALGRISGSAEFTVCRSPGCSSLYRPNTDWIQEFHFSPNMEVLDVIPIEVTTLDELAEEHRLSPDVIKVDTQGSELDILQGGVGLVRTAKLIEVEVEFNPQYVGQPLFSDMDLWLRSQGFALLGIRRSHWRRIYPGWRTRGSSGGTLIHGDALFYNRRLLEPDCAASQRDIIAFCIALSAYKQTDFVDALLLKPHPALLSLSTRDRERLTRTLLPSMPLWMNSLRWLVSLQPHTRMRKFLDAARRPGAVDWHDPDFY